MQESSAYTKRGFGRKWFDTSIINDRHVCNKCGKSYSQRKHLARHCKYECDNKAQFSCYICGFKSNRNDNLSAHLASCKRKIECKSYFMK